MKFEAYQDRLKELGLEAGEMRRAADASTGESRKSFNAQYTRLLTKIDMTVADIKTEHPKHCWRDEDPKYKALVQQWRDARAKGARNEDFY